MIHRDHKSEFSEWPEGPNEGQNLKWILHGEHKNAVHLGALYVPCKSINAAERQNVVNPILKMIEDMKEMPYVIMADINLDIQHSQCEEARRWRAALQAAGAEVINHDEFWGSKPTRLPTGEQNQLPSHLDVIIVSQPVLRKMLPQMVAIGSGDDEIDGDQEQCRLEKGAVYTDHKVLTCNLTTSSPTGTKPQPSFYLRWALSRVEKDPKLKLEFQHTLEERGTLRRIAADLRAKRTDPTGGQDEIARELLQVADIVVGSIWTTKNPKPCRLFPYKVNKAFRAMQYARKRPKHKTRQSASVEAIDEAERKYKKARSAFKATSRREAGAKVQRQLAEAAKQGATAAQKTTAKVMKKLTGGGRAGKANAAFECATLEYPKGALTLMIAFSVGVGRCVVGRHWVVRMDVLRAVAHLRPAQDTLFLRLAPLLACARLAAVTVAIVASDGTVMNRNDRSVVSVIVEGGLGIAL